MKRLRHILQHRYLFKILACLITIGTLIYTSNIKRESIYSDETEFVGIVYKIKIKDNKSVLYLKAREKIIVNYYNVPLSNIKIGDKIKVFGELSLPSNNTIPNGFNYKKYLYNNNIFYIINASRIKKLSNNTNIIYYFKDKIQSRINKISNRSEYLKIFILGDNTSLDEDIMTSYRNNGISHLFSISGMHISFFAVILLYLLKRISYNNYLNYGVIIFFLFMYSLLVGMTPSVARSLTMYILFTLNKLLNLKIKKIDIVCIVLIILLLLKPLYIYNNSFLYSYIISSSLIIFSYKIKTIKNKLKKNIIYFIYFIYGFITYMYLQLLPSKLPFNYFKYYIYTISKYHNFSIIINEFYTSMFK